MPVTRRPLLQTLRSQALLVLTAIFLLSHVFSILIYETNRQEVVIQTEAVDLADRIIGVVDLAQRFPPSDRAQILSAAETQFLFMYPEASRTDYADCEENRFSDLITNRLNRWFTLYPGLDASVCVIRIDEARVLRQPDFSSLPGLDALVYVDFPDGEQAIFRATLPDAQSLFSDIILLYILMVSLGTLMVGWVLIRRVLTPLDQLAQAADVIGTNLDAPSLSEQGPSEVVRAARAFNQMQARLRRLVQGQTETLAAVSHDLRSAATRLQLRADLLENEQEREGMLRVVSDMSAMIQSVLEFVRGVEPNEKARRTDVLALLESMTDDLEEEGFPVHFESDGQSVMLDCRPVSLRRCVQNIIDNAVKYGEEAWVSCRVVPEGFCITVKDRGPGVDKSELQNILRPFYRLESSRNRDNGGIGLGLAIAQNIVKQHGGELHISNREDAPEGLQVDIILPRVLDGRHNG